MIEPDLLFLRVEIYQIIGTFLGALCSDKYFPPECWEQNKRGALKHRNQIKMKITEDKVFEFLFQLLGEFCTKM